MDEEAALISQRDAALQAARHLRQEYEKQLRVLSRCVDTAQQLQRHAEGALARMRHSAQKVDVAGGRFLLAVPLSLFLGMCAAAAHAVIHSALVPGTLDSGRCIMFFPATIVFSSLMLGIADEAWCKTGGEAMLPTEGARGGSGSLLVCIPGLLLAYLYQKLDAPSSLGLVAWLCLACGLPELIGRRFAKGSSHFVPAADQSTEPPSFLHRTSPSASPMPLPPITSNAKVDMVVWLLHWCMLGAVECGRTYTMWALILALGMGFSSQERRRALVRPWRFMWVCVGTVVQREGQDDGHGVHRLPCDLTRSPGGAISNARPRSREQRAEAAYSSNRRHHRRTVDEAIHVADGDGSEGVPQAGDDPNRRRRRRHKHKRSYS